MYPEKTSLSIRLTEPVVPLRSTPEHASRYNDGQMLPPAVVRGLLTLTLAKPSKVSSIELELQAKATTHYTQGAGPSRTDVTEQYKVHSATTVLFKAGSVPQIRRRASSTRPRVQFLDNYTGSDAQLHPVRLNDTPSGSHPVTRSVSPNPRSLRVRRRLSSDDLEIDDDTHSHSAQVSIDHTPPYHSLAGQHSFLGADSHSSMAGRSQSLASSSRTMEQLSSPIQSQSSLTPDIPCGSPTSSVHSTRDFALSHASSIEEDNGESFVASAQHPGNVAYYGLSRIATGSSGRSSEQDHRGRSPSRFSFGKVVHIFDTVKDRVRSQSPRAGSLPRLNEHERGRSLMQRKGNAQVGTHGVGNALPQTRADETSVAGGANDQYGDGWVVFPEGTYTYPMLFTIPNNSLPTMKADHASLTWKVKAEVKRPGVFKSNMTAREEVIVVSVPKSDNSEGVEGLDLQRAWDGQFQYRVQIPGRGFPIGGKIPFQLTIIPLEKIKVHCIWVYLDERTVYYTQAGTQARSDAIRRATLLVIKHNNSNRRHSEPILPLVSDGPDTFRKSPLYRFLKPGENEDEVATSFMGSGPWTICHQLRVPNSCSILHPSNWTKGSNVMVDHTLKIVLRVEKVEENTATTRRRKLHDIVIHAPIQILSCHCTSEWTSLPRYDEAALRSVGNFSENTSTSPCCARHPRRVRTLYHETDTLPVPPQHVASLPTTNPNPAGGLCTFSSDSLACLTHLHGLLMCGLVNERGEAPPSYKPVHA